MRFNRQMVIYFALQIVRTEDRLLELLAENIKERHIEWLEVRLSMISVNEYHTTSGHVQLKYTFNWMATQNVVIAYSTSRWTLAPVRNRINLHQDLNILPFEDKHLIANTKRNTIFIDRRIISHSFYLIISYNLYLLFGKYNLIKIQELKEVNQTVNLYFLNFQKYINGGKIAAVSINYECKLYYILDSFLNEKIIWFSLKQNIIFFKENNILP